MSTNTNTIGASAFTQESAQNLTEKLHEEWMVALEALLYVDSEDEIINEEHKEAVAILREIKSTRFTRMKAEQELEKTLVAYEERRKKAQALEAAFLGRSAIIQEQSQAIRDNIAAIDLMIAEAEARAYL